ncbi:MAG: adenine nucleotide alpha hydrolase [Acidobacteria bacterium]|nr:adenine nucleotide alpha hydrolase [Acidobacteriota bacterium]
MKRVLLSWSGGKDSAWALHLLRRSPAIRIEALLTTFNEAFDRVAMHAVRRTLIEAQAESAGIPLWTVPLPWPCSNSEYESRMAEACGRAVALGLTGVVFGDLYLTDIRQYRERQLQGTGLEPMFPLWQIPTGELAREMISAGLRARLTCVDPRLLPRDFAGREFDVRLLEDLPAGVDPCGENGEFHTYVYDGPMLQKPIPVEVGAILERDGFVFADLLGA